MQYTPIHLFLFLLLLSLSLQSQNAPPIAVESNVTSATVYLNAAEVTRTPQVTLNSGTHTLVFQQLSHRMDNNSVRLGADIGVNILSVSVRAQDRRFEAKPLEVQTLEDSIALVEDEIELLNSDVKAYQEEKELLLQNRSIGSSKSGVDIAELQKAADFYRQRIRNIHQLLDQNQKGLKAWQNKLEELQHRLKIPLQQWQTPKKEVLATVEVSRSQIVNFELKYLVTNALWNPSYNLRATDVNQPIRLEYQAQVYNDTGIDWKNVQLTLSTADPTQDASKPQLEVWRLNHNQVRNKGEGYSDDRPYLYYDGLQVAARKPEIGEMQQIEVGELSSEFVIEKPYNIPAVAQPFQVAVKQHDLEAIYMHYCVPKLDKGVFLLARITKWENLNLIEGPANVYYQDTYMGKSYLQTSGIQDTLDLSLGRDEKVVVTRTKRQDLSGKKFFGFNVKETFLYEIAIRNNRNIPITLEVQDQIPVAQEKDIQVEQLDLGNAVLDELSGRLSWKNTLQSGESKKWNLSFSVKYPKGKYLAIRRSRKIYCPRF